MDADHMNRVAIIPYSCFLFVSRDVILTQFSVNAAQCERHRVRDRRERDDEMEGEGGGERGRTRAEQRGKSKRCRNDEEREREWKCLIRTP